MNDAICHHEPSGRFRLPVIDTLSDSGGGRIAFASVYSKQNAASDAKHILGKYSLYKVKICSGGA